jgi:hypothetical protein
MFQSLPINDGAPGEGQGLSSMKCIGKVGSDEVVLLNPMTLCHIESRNRLAEA